MKKPESQKTYRSVVAPVVFLLSPVTGHACDGTALVETNALYEHFQLASQSCNETGSVQDAANCMEAEWGYNAGKVNALPEDCRAMLQEFAPAE